MAYHDQRLLTFSDPMALRVNGPLAAEIGLNESIVLLQIEFLIATNGYVIDGERWTHGTVPELLEYFPWWNQASLSRALRRLREMRLIKTSNFNETQYNRTNWYALDAEGVSQLQSVRLTSTQPRSGAPKPKRESSPQQAPHGSQSEDSNLNHASCQNAIMHDSKMNLRSDQNDMMHDSNSTASIMSKVNLRSDQNDMMLKGTRELRELRESPSDEKTVALLIGDGDDGFQSPAHAGDDEDCPPHSARPPRALHYSETVQFLKDMKIQSHAEFADLPPAPVKEFVEELLDGGANKNMIVAALRRSREQLTPSVVDPAPTKVPHGPETHLRPEWIPGEFWDEFPEQMKAWMPAAWFEPTTGLIQVAERMNETFRAFWFPWLESLEVYLCQQEVPHGAH